MLELGAGPQWNQGASARTFRDYLPADSEIYVVDISSECLEPLNNIDNVITILADLGSTEEFQKIHQYGPFDFIIDDASHQWKHQTDSVSWLWPALSQWGVFIVEDIQTSFGYDREHHNPHGLPSDRDFYSCILSLLSSYVGRSLFHPIQESLPSNPFESNILGHLSSISFIPGAAILQKGSNENPYLHYH